MKGLEGETIQAQPVNLQRFAEKPERLKGFWGIKKAYRERYIRQIGTFC